MSEIALEDVQAQVPTLPVSLSRVGVTNVEKVIRIQVDGAEQLFSARLDCFVDLGPQQKGAHMSRFEEVVNDALGEVVLGESAFRAETLAQHIAEKVRDRQGARRAEVHIEARYPEHKPAPVSGILTQEIYSLLGVAVASAAGTRRLVGVRAQGMTACPCAQTLVEGRARERLADGGFTGGRHRAHHRGRARRHPQPARPRHAAHRLPRGLRHGHRRRDAARDRRGLDVVGDLRADEAHRRGRRGREGPPPPALRRGLRARDDPRGRRRLRRPSPTATSSRPARRTSRRSTSTTSPPSASACSARSGTS